MLARAAAGVVAHPAVGGTIGQWRLSLFGGVISVADYQDPSQAGFPRTHGKDAWFGWPGDARTETICDEWPDATSAAARTRLERAFQLRAFEVLPYNPSGGYKQTSAWRDNVRGILKRSSIVFRNVSKT